jgi:hypothetical protein
MEMHESSKELEELSLARLDAGKEEARVIFTNKNKLPSFLDIMALVDGLNTANLSDFSFNLGRIKWYAEENSLRAGVLLGQDIGFLDWFDRFYNVTSLQTHILQLVGLFLQGQKRPSPQADLKVVHKYLPRAFKRLEEIVFQVEGTPHGRPKFLKKLSLKVETESFQTPCDTSRGLEQSNPRAASIIYCLMILGKSLKPDYLLAHEDKKYEILILQNLMLLKDDYKKIGKGEFKNTIMETVNTLLSIISQTMTPKETKSKLVDLIELSLVYQTRSDFFFTIEGFLMEVVSQNSQEVSLILSTLLNDQKELEARVLSNCMKLRSILFMTKIFGACHKQLAAMFFNLGGRNCYIQIFERCILQEHIPTIYIFLEDEELFKQITPHEEKVIISMWNLIYNSKISYNHQERIAAFIKNLSDLKYKKDNCNKEFVTYSKTFTERETAELTMKGTVSNIWRSNNPAKKNLRIEVKHKKKRQSVELDLTATPVSNKSKKSRKGFTFDSIDDEPVSPSSKTSENSEEICEAKDEASKTKGPFINTQPKIIRDKQQLYVYDTKRELSSVDVLHKIKGFFGTNPISQKIELVGNYPTSLIYHRRVLESRELYFAVLKVVYDQDIVRLVGLIYCKRKRRINLMIRLKEIADQDVENRHYYENDSITFCTNISEDSKNRFYVVLMDRNNGRYRLKYFNLETRQENFFEDLEPLFTNEGIKFGGMHTFKIASGHNTILVGCRHLTAIFGFENSVLTFQTMIREIGFRISKYRLMNYEKNCFMILGHVCKDFYIMNLSKRKLFHFCFGWLEDHQSISEVELEENIMVYLIEDNIRKKSSVYMIDDDKVGAEVSKE